MIKLLMILLGTAFYVKGETETKWLGKSNKWWKYAVGCPIALLACLMLHTFMPLLAIGSYFLASWALPYGDNSPITKLVGKRGAITIHGCGVGLASLPIVGVMAIVGAVFSGLCFLLIAIADDNEKCKEPLVAILRGLAGTICLLF